MGFILTITGGRPMKKIKRVFVDPISKKDVFLWVDLNGEHWLAYRPWSISRVKPMKNYDDLKEQFRDIKFSVEFGASCKFFGITEVQLKTLTEKELKKRWKKLAFNAHPDLGGSKKSFVKLNTHYEKLQNFVCN